MGTSLLFGEPVFDYVVRRVEMLGDSGGSPALAGIVIRQHNLKAVILHFALVRAELPCLRERTLSYCKRAATYLARFHPCNAGVLFRNLVPHVPEQVAGHDVVAERFLFRCVWHLHTHSVVQLMVDGPM